MSHKTLLIGGIIALIVGILGDIIAAWVIQDLLGSSFKPNSLVIIACITILGVLLSAILEGRRSTPSNSMINVGRTKGGYFHNLKLFRSKLKTRGRNTILDDVISVSSEIDINAEDTKES